MTTDNDTYQQQLDDLLARSHEVLRVEPKGRSFAAVCACGYRSPVATTTRIAYADGCRHVWRMAQRAADAEWYRSRQVARCGVDAGSRPYWMSPDQYDPCPCALAPGHEGPHRCGIEAHNAKS